MFFCNHPERWLLLLPALFLVACASPRSPTGGPPDEAPPVIIEEESTPNYQTNFQDREITLTFDEWITLKDVFTQLVVSPLMLVQPEINQKGKVITISLPDSLLEETTYTINFGNSIADLNEGNKLENFAFVFSTGDVLDSIGLSGKVINAVTLSPQPDIWVMLHPARRDSAVYKDKPQYVAKTNKEGQWSLANIRSDSFQLMALKDENLNFLYDQETELFGWQEEIIYTDQPKIIIPDIFVFPKESRVFIRDVQHATPGWLKLVIGGPLPKISPRLEPDLGRAIKVWDGDTLHYWYDPLVNYSGLAVLNQDTFSIRLAPGEAPSATKLGIVSFSGRIHPLASAMFMTTAPIVSLMDSTIMLTNDSSEVIPFTLVVDSSDARRMQVDARWQPETRYTLTFLPGSIQDIWGRYNDTIRMSITVSSAEQFGDLTINVSGLDSAMQYFLLLKSGEKKVAQFSIVQKDEAQFKNAALSPGKYVIEVVEDINGNGIWDTGDYDARRLPERKNIFVPENLRAAWEVETKIIWQ